MSVQNEAGEPEELYTVDELAAVTGMTVRTTRYYSGLGLLPTPIRRGRMAYYTEEHRARLDLIRALQDHGFTLSAIERYLGRVPLDATVEDLALQKALLTSWTGTQPEVLTRRQLETRFGRPLSQPDLDRLVEFYAVRPEGERYELLPAFEVALKLGELELPDESVRTAAVAINQHMDQLADELTEVMRSIVVPSRESAHSEAEKAKLEQTVSRLRQLTLEAVVAGFQRAANEVISRSLAEPTD